MLSWRMFLESRGIGVHEMSGELRSRCPFCGSDSRHPFCVQERSGVFFCHACEEKGTGVTLVAKLLGLSYRDAARYVRGKAYWRYASDADYEPVSPSVRATLPPEYRRLAGSESVVAGAYRDYAHSRGLSDELIQRYDIGYAATGRYAGRLIVPVYQFGVLCSFVARAIGDREPKVLTPPGNQQSRCLFNLDTVLGADSIVVVEGVFDALTLPDRCVASFGKRLSRAQAALLLRSGAKEVTFAFDGDAAREAARFAQRCVARFACRIVRLPDGEDPSSLGPSRFAALLEEAKPVRPGVYV